MAAVDPGTAGGPPGPLLRVLGSSFCPSAPAETSLQAALHQSIFLSAMSAQPGRDLSLCWEQHRKLLPGVARETAETVQHWSVQQVSRTVGTGGTGVSSRSNPSHLQVSDPSPSRWRSLWSHFLVARSSPNSLEMK